MEEEKKKRREKVTKLGKPYKRLQSQGQGHVKKWPTVFVHVCSEDLETREQKKKLFPLSVSAFRRPTVKRFSDLNLN